jgi:hypothetical protein
MPVGMAVGLSGWRKTSVKAAGRWIGNNILGGVSEDFQKGLGCDESFLLSGL